MRLLILSNKLDGHQYMALFDTLAEEKKEGLIPDTVVFLSAKCFAWAGTWVPSEEIRDHIDVDFCQANDIPVLWEPCMGGAYFFPDNNWNCWFFLTMNRSFVKRVNRWHSFLHIVTDALKQIGVNATVEKNNIMVGTRKISGTTINHYGNKATTLESSINVEFDYDLANKVLTPLGRRNKVLSDAIISLEDLGINLKPEELNSFFKKAIEDGLGVQLIEGELTEAEKVAVGLA